MTPETALYEFLFERAGLEVGQSDLVVQATAYQRLDSVKTIRIGNAETMFGLQEGGGVGEYDADLTLQILHRVEDTDDADSLNLARDGATQIAKWAVKEIQTDDSLGSRVCGVNVYKALRGWAKIETAPFAVILIPLRINPLSME
jgi:hypothetical protein